MKIFNLFKSKQPKCKIISVRRILTQDEIRDLSRYNSGYGLKIITAPTDGSYIQLLNPIILYKRTGGFLSDSDLIIITKKTDLYECELNNLTEPEKYPALFKYGITSQHIVNEDIYLTGGKINPDYEGTAILSYDYKIIK